MLLHYLLSAVNALNWSSCMALSSRCFSNLVIVRNAKACEQVEVTNELYLRGTELFEL